MQLGRRSFVFWTLGFILWVRDVLAAPVGGTRRQAYSLTALPPFLDILIPRDETGSATDLGVDRTLIDRARGDRGFLRILRGGCKWLDFEARKHGGLGFADLESETQEGIVVQASQARRGTLPRVFFDAIREYGFRTYYADPASWPSLGYWGPPQPEGFMDHAEAPR